MLPALQYFDQGRTACMAVCKLALPVEAVCTDQSITASTGSATGFLIGPCLIATAGHALPTAHIAAASHAVFGDDQPHTTTVPNQRKRVVSDLRSGALAHSVVVHRVTRAVACLQATLQLSPQDGFVHMPDLDITLCALASAPPRHQPVEAAAEPVRAGHPLSIIHHPRGASKQLSLHGCRALQVYDQSDSFTFDVVSDFGSSGAPVSSTPSLPRYS